MTLIPKVYIFNINKYFLKLYFIFYIQVKVELRAEISLHCGQNFFQIFFSFLKSFSLFKV